MNTSNVSDALMASASLEAAKDCSCVGVGIVLVQGLHACFGSGTCQMTSQESWLYVGLHMYCAQRSLVRVCECYAVVKHLKNEQGFKTLF